MVTIHQSSAVLNTGSTFFVPQGNFICQAFHSYVVLVRKRCFTTLYVKTPKNRKFIFKNHHSAPDNETEKKMYRVLDLKHFAAKKKKTPELKCTQDI